MNSAVIPFNYENQAVRFNSDGWINATDIAKRYGKRPVDWLRLPAWVADITYVRTRSGWVYLAAVMDLFSRKIVGWAMAPHMRAELVTSAMQLAIAQRRPEPDLFAHSDRGSQYAGAAYQALLTRNGIAA